MAWVIWWKFPYGGDTAKTFLQPDGEWSFKRTDAKQFATREQAEAEVVEIRTRELDGSTGIEKLAA